MNFSIRLHDLWGSLDSLAFILKAYSSQDRRGMRILSTVSDGPLENLCGGGGGGGERAKYKKKYSRKGKLNEKKFMHAN